MAVQTLLEEHGGGGGHVQAKVIKQVLGILLQVVINADVDVCHTIISFVYSIAYVRTMSTRVER